MRVKVANLWKINFQMKFVQFLTALLWLCSGCFGDTILQPIKDINACLEEELTFFCNVTNLQLTWTWQNDTTEVQQFYYPNVVQIPLINRTQDLEGVPGVTTTLLELGLEEDIYTISTLQFTILDGLLPANICCNNECRMVKIKDFSVLSYVRFHHFVNNTNNSIVTLTWGTNTSANTYTITVISLEEQFDIIVTNSFFVNITLQYNTNYTVRIVTSGCNKQNSTATTNIKLVKCTDPKYLPGVEAILYSKGTHEGSVFSYTCTDDKNTGRVLRSHCTNNGLWQPNINCSLQSACNLPNFNQNAPMLNISEDRSFGDFLYYSCKEGFSPTYVVKSTCTEIGEWKPNPLEHMCSQRKETNCTSSLTIASVSVFVVALLSSLCAFIFGWKMSSYFHRKTLKMPNKNTLPEDKQETRTVNTISEDTSLPQLETTPTYEELTLSENLVTTKNIAYGELSRKNK